ncbi:MAG TPA: hypothetical protein PKA28_02235 [Methylomusa anaerophila]|uniref:Stage III sporulation protein AG n=1 Tax=Methylomusa anaerophila TaxID=1930071 RepID=A0A348APB4_9FIRM|nr:hypothetical protein [Methylomusa anaerophila]BBB92912.1 hypothetical protein MAMMFC1_03620 [Methylomusa anaerophila]HML87252.1 hypothetical protein [Methylomusa anaerophila]
MAALGTAIQDWLSQAKKITKGGNINFRLILLGVIGIILLLVSGLLESPQTKTKIPVVLPNESAKTAVGNRSFEEAMEAKLANTLAQIKGAGTVSVSITLESSGMSEHAKNVTRETKVIQEKDTAGGIRTTTETKETEQILLSKDNGNDHPVMVRESKPVIKGVLIVAEGANDSNVKANITKAIESGLGVPSYKVTVLPQRR